MTMSKTIEEMWNTNLNNCDINDFYKYSKTKYWLNCNKCNHIFNISYSKYKYDRWCPYCCKPPKKLCNDECTICFKKSFASNPKSIYWSNINGKLPRQVFNGTRKKYFFNCNKCSHVFDISIDAINILNQWCQFCANQKLCKTYNCTQCFEKSFASHPKSKHWSEINKLKPIDVFKGTHKKYKFNCNICFNTFDIAIKKITYENNWCSKCKYKTELKLFDYLKQIYKDDVMLQVKFDWCKNKKHLPFDFLIKSKKCIIELDGPQHFKQVSNWKSPQQNQEIDKFKMDIAIQNGYRIIRLLQKDVFKDVFDWQSELITSINSNEKCIFVSNNDEYKIFKNEFKNN